MRNRALPLSSVRAGLAGGARGHPAVMSNTRCDMPDPPPASLEVRAPETAENIASAALPVIRRVLARRLGFHLHHHGQAANPEAEDLAQEVLQKLVSQQRALAGSHSRAHPNWLGLIHEIAEHACTDFLRRRHWQRQSLKGKLHWLLAHRQPWALWQEEGGEWWCGHATDRGRINARAAPARLAPLQENPHAVMQREIPTLVIEQAELPVLVAAIFQLTGGTLRFEELVTIVAHLQGLTDEPPVSLADERHRLAETMADPHAGIHAELEAAQSMRHIWLALRRLTWRQCRAVLLGGQARAGDDIPSLLLDSGAATLEERAVDVLSCCRRLISSIKAFSSAFRGEAFPRRCPDEA